MRLTWFCFIVFLSLNAWAQDPIFTQFYSAPTLLNPGFAGSMNSTRFTGGYRSQWRGVSSNFNTFQLSGDTFIGSINSGVGINIVQQSEETTSYSYTQINALYSFHIQLDDEWALFPGISFGYGLRQFQFQNLLFEDQIDIIGQDISPTQDIQNFKTNVNLFDLSSGLVLYHTRAWVGLSFRHLANPNISFLEDEILKLETLFSIHGGYRFTLQQSQIYNDDSSGKYLFLTGNYVYQRPFERFDIGAEVQLSDFFFGVLASTTFNSNDSNQNLISVNPLTGIQINKVRIGISYDIPVSSIGSNAGTVEVTAQFFLGDEYVRKRRWQIKN